jgi:hypothetical protein
VNFTDRVQVFRRNPGTQQVFEEIYASLACQFEVLSANMYAQWANPQDDFTVTKANLHIPLTIPDLPEPGYLLQSYAIVPLSPKVGWLHEDGLTTWTIETKRPTRNHVIYLLTL